MYPPHRQLFERTRLLDVRKDRLELVQFNINFLFRLFRLATWKRVPSVELLFPIHREETHNLGLESLDGLHMCVHIIGDILQDLLCLVNNGLVLQREPVVGEIDCRWLVVILMRQPLSLVVTLAESLERSDCL